MSELCFMDQDGGKVQQSENSFAGDRAYNPEIILLSLRKSCSHSQHIQGERANETRRDTRNEIPLRLRLNIARVKDPLNGSSQEVSCCKPNTTTGYNKSCLSIVRFRTLKRSGLSARSKWSKTHHSPQPHFLLEPSRIERGPGFRSHPSVASMWTSTFHSYWPDMSPVEGDQSTGFSQL